MDDGSCSSRKECVYVHCRSEKRFLFPVVRQKDRSKMHEDIKFIKENLFDPHNGLWAESKQNTQFRKDTTKWRGVMGTGFIGLFFKQMYDLFT